MSTPVLPMSVPVAVATVVPILSSSSSTSAADAAATAAALSSSSFSSLKKRPSPEEQDSDDGSGSDGDEVSPMGGGLQPKLKKQKKPRTRLGKDDVKSLDQAFESKMSANPTLNTDTDHSEITAYIDQTVEFYNGDIRDLAARYLQKKFGLTPYKKTRAKLTAEQKEEIQRKKAEKIAKMQAKKGRRDGLDEQDGSMHIGDQGIDKAALLDRVRREFTDMDADVSRFQVEGVFQSDCDHLHTIFQKCQSLSDELIGLKRDKKYQRESVLLLANLEQRQNLCASLRNAIKNGDDEGVDVDYNGTWADKFLNKEEKHDIDDTSASDSQKKLRPGRADITKMSDKQLKAAMKKAPDSVAKTTRRIVNLGIELQRRSGMLPSMVLGDQEGEASAEEQQLVAEANDHLKRYQNNMVRVNQLRASRRHLQASGTSFSKPIFCGSFHDGKGTFHHFGSEGGVTMPSMIVFEAHLGSNNPTDVVAVRTHASDD